MAASNVAIANLALTKLGDLRILNLTDNTKPAREVNAVFDMTRDYLQRRFSWRFCIKRANLAADTTVPLWDWSYQYPIPADCMRILQVGQWYPSPDMSDLISTGGQEYVLEGKYILSNQAGPLKLRYLSRVTDPVQFDAAFDMAFSAYLAYILAEPLTASAEQKQMAYNDYRNAIKDAVIANAIENPPESLADQTWILARL
ncbi:MAG: hypothetical protein OEY28_04435 [Nitrospira sp.]|nr:hypothetical protein [Nitrospira sp.]